MVRELDLRAIRADIAAAMEPVRQGSGAIWELSERRAKLEAIAHLLVDEVDRLVGIIEGGQS